MALARRHPNVRGWVRNLPDGRVEVVAEGPRAAVEMFITEVRRGPLGAFVEDVRAEWEPPQRLQGFRIQ